MPKLNKVTGRVFADIAETDGLKSEYDKFLSIDKTMGIEETPILMSIKEKYSELVHSCSNDIKTLAALEEIIIQIRSKYVIDSELRLSLSRNYIYARSTFYRRGNQINDIRVIVGKYTDFGVPPLFGADLVFLMKDEKFRFICKQKLLEAMDKEITENIKYVNQLITV